MTEFLTNLFDAGNFMPHGHCYLWNPGLVKLHLFSDLAIGSAYVAISLGLAYFVRQAKNDLPFSWIFVGFGVFILACGATHFMEIWTLWTPLYWLAGLVKLVTAAASLVIAVLLPPLLPKGLLLIRTASLSERRKADLEKANEALAADSSERKKSQEEIRILNLELEERVLARTAELADANRRLADLAAIVENSDEAIIGTSLNHCITSWNPAAERMYGYRTAEVLGRSISLLAPAERSSEMFGMIERLRRGEHLDSMETIRVRKSGERITVYLTLSPIKDAIGEVQGASHIARDITERKRAEDMFRLVVEAAPNAMVVADGEGKIVLVNAQTEKLFGYTRQELIGQEVDILAPPMYRVHHSAHRAEYMREPHTRGMTAPQELFGYRKDGVMFPVEIGLNPVKTDNGTWVLSAIVDITDRRRAEMEIIRLNHDLEGRVNERTAELTAANAELEAFTYSVSHDLRAPLRQIAGFSKILTETQGRELNSEGHRYLQRVQDGAEHMGNLIDDLLNLSRIGRQSVSRRPQALNELVEAALEVLKPECAGREIEWQIDSLWTAECDPGLLKQVFVNLLSNALKYTRIRDRAVIQVGQAAANGERVVFVRDNGAGFDMRYAGKLFGVFQRLHRADDFEGTGVGLAICHRIILKHGGRIWAEAELDEGATFFLTIPNGPGSKPAPGENSGENER